MKQNSYDLLVAAELAKGESFPRELARSLNTNPMSVIRSLRQLMKNKVVDFKAVGKSKVFFLRSTIQGFTYACMAEEHKRLRLFEKYPSLSILAEDILKKTDSGLVILFGSYAKFSANKESDIDIYVETSDRKVKTELEQINSGLSVKIGIFDMEDLLIREIIKNHIILRGTEYYYEKTGFFEKSNLREKARDGG
jgi:predicted nucleotidyltransferase